jgi:hypothetical protein
LDISGGVVSYDNNYTIRTFYTSGNLTVVGSGTLSTEYLVVGSGANGANGTLGVLSGGGGGSGDVKTGNVIISAGVYPVDVGLNAAGNGTSKLTVFGQNFSALKGDNAIGANGGDSGAGPSVGNATGGNSLSGGAGGGAGGNAVSVLGNVGDVGGSGIFSAITGINQAYAGGGGGGGRDGGGSGGGGGGRGASLTANATVPTSYGSGGGGGYQYPDSGGRPATLGKDGIVIVRYLTSGTAAV